MPDRLTPEQRHRCMSHIRSKNTQPELKVRQWLWQHGYRYRLNVKGVPGKPDIVMRKYRTAIFVNGCFWHGHNVKFPDVETHGRASGITEPMENSPCCKIPNTNREFWVNKIRRNQSRDEQNYKILQENGWQVIVLWECQLAKSKIDFVMRNVEILLHDYFIATFSSHSKRYLPPDIEIPIAAEPPVGYEP